LSRPAIALFAGLAILRAAAPARAQISPGPLSGAHAGLEGATRCFECHRAGERELAPRCLACHAEIAALANAGRGLHAREGRAECASCHPEHAGRDFELIDWGGDVRAFDHARTGWPLEDRHAELDCRTCHNVEHQVGAAARLARRRDRATSWLGLETACGACHADPHEARLGVDCASCHTAAGWRVTAAGFDHSRTRYTLEGAHTRVACAACHGEGAEWIGRPSADRCGDCHADAHAGQVAGALVSDAGDRASGGARDAARGDCAVCHDVRAFRPSTYTAARHADSPFPLEGRHAAVACAACHPRGSSSVGRERLGSAGVLLRRPHAACRDCHEDAHAGQLAHRADGGACEACHDVRGWTPARFDRAEHAATRFPLEGAHAEAPCSACHGPKRAGLPPIPEASQVGAGARLFAFDEIGCAACHADPHDGRYAEGGALPHAGGCGACHGFESFRPSRIEAADHERLGYALEGSHRAVACDDCHADLARPPARSTLLLAAPPVAPLALARVHARCADCHADPHHGQFAGRAGGDECGVCHGTDAFRPASRFDHDHDARFALGGAHASVACAKCHPGGDGGDAAAAQYRPRPIECSACHGTAP
jgi:hypothetical protein